MTQDSLTETVARVAEGRCAADEREFGRELLTRVGDRWTLVVVSELRDGPVRFTALLDRIDGISHRMLARTLQTLHRDGLVARTAYPEVPPRVEYELTALGRKLLVPVVALLAWTAEHQAEILSNRAAFDG